MDGTLRVVIIRIAFAIHHRNVVAPFLFIRIAFATTTGMWWLLSCSFASHSPLPQECGGSFLVHSHRIRHPPQECGGSFLVHSHRIRHPPQECGGSCNCAENPGRKSAMAAVPDERFRMGCMFLAR
jgi:hypothetical protein